MSVHVLSADELRRALSVPDLSDPAHGPHAMQLLVADALDALRRSWGCEVVVERQSPIVPTADNYDRLHYPPDGAARDARYTRYVSNGTLLRTQTSAMIPPLLRRLAALTRPPADVLLACPGLVYRRDCLDRLHTGEPQQLDLWRVRQGAPLDTSDLVAMVGHVLEATLPGHEWRAVPAVHPYTTDGLQLDVRNADGWVEVGECGLALPELLAESGLRVPPASGLAMGLGLDRLLMLRKGIEDIRLLRSRDPRVSAQMLDLSRYRRVSAMPAVRRDLSIVRGRDEPSTAEEIGDEVRTALGERAALVESVEVVAETAVEELPQAAIVRLGIGPGQKNVLVRLALRALDRTLTHDECNALRDEVYTALHRGKVWYWTARGREAGEGRTTVGE
jgi:phenylalanyl-tRNA synthetase alpha chain